MSCDCDFILLVSAIKSSLFSSGCCKSVTLSATGEGSGLGLGEKQKEWPSYLGKYEATAKKQEGAPVFKNSNGRYLYRVSGGSWRANPEIGSSEMGSHGFIRSMGSSATAECPTTISQDQWSWKYDDEGEGNYQSSDITVKCN